MIDWTPYIKSEAGAGRQIEKRRVLLVVNSSAPLSAQVADYYSAAHNGYITHRVNLALGTAAAITSATRYQDVVLPIADYCEANGIECVLSSAAVPHFFADSSGQLISADAVFGAAKFFKAQGNLNLPIGNTTVGEKLGAPITVTANFNGQLEWAGESKAGGEPLAPNGLSYEVAKTFNPRFKERPIILPWGRIGVPKFTSATPAETFAETQRMIDDARSMEVQNYRASLRVAVGVGGNTGRIMPQWQWMAHAMAKAAGHDAQHILSSYGITNSGWFGQTAQWLQSDIWAGTAHVDADIYIGGGIGNIPDTVSTINNSLFPKRGAWAYESWSFGYRLAVAVILRGGCAGIGSIAEPFESGIPDSASVMTAALRGYSLAEINWFLSPAPWMMTVFGDPLYRPFRPLGLMGGAGKARNVTQARSAKPTTPARSVRKL